MLDKHESIFFNLIAILLTTVLYLAGIDSYTYSSNIFLVLGVTLLLLNLSITYRLGFFLFFISIGFLTTFYSKISYLAYPISFIGYFLFLNKLKSPNFNKTYLLLIPLLIHLMIAQWDRDYLSPQYFEKILLGTTHADTLYHIALSNIIKNYGFPSIGIDGLIYTPYHYGSHYIFAYLSNFFSLHTIQAYNFIVPILLIPLLLKCLYDISYFFIQETLKYQISHTYLTYFFCLAVIGILTPEIQTLINQRNSIFLSESYLVSMIFFSFCLHFLHLKNRPHASYALFILSFIIICFSKVSTAFMFMAYWSFLIITKKDYLSIRKNYFFILCTLISLIIVKYTFPTGNFNQDGSSFELLSFFKQKFSLSTAFLHIVLFYLTTWFVVFFDKNNLISRKQKYLLVSILILGLIPGNVVNIPGGSAYYFLDIINWICIPYFVVVADSLRARLNFSKLSALLLGSALFIGTLSAIKKPHKEIIHNKKEIALSQITSSPAYDYLKILFDYSKTYIAKEHFIYIPRENTIYWNSLDCVKIPLLAQALTGSASVYGNPIFRDCSSARGRYGFDLYNHESVGNFTLACESANKFNKKLVILDPNDGLKLAPCGDK